MILEMELYLSLVVVLTTPGGGQIELRGGETRVRRPLPSNSQAHKTETTKHGLPSRKLLDISGGLSGRSRTIESRPVAPRLGPFCVPYKSTSPFQILYVLHIQMKVATSTRIFRHCQLFSTGSYHVPSRPPRQELQRILKLHGKISPQSSFTKII